MKKVNTASKGYDRKNQLSDSEDNFIRKGISKYGYGRWISILVRAPRGVYPTNSGRDVILGLKVAIGHLVLGTICWDGQFYLKRSKIKGSLGVPAEFPPEKWSTPKN